MQSLREMTIQEVWRTPDTRLQELYNVVRSYSAERGTSSEQSTSSIERFAGVWASTPDGEFEEFLADIRSRRRTAFGNRERP